MAKPSGRDIRAAVIGAAQSAIQKHGSSGFSYGDLAKAIGVKAPSIHHHFRRKDELIATTTREYRQHFHQKVVNLQPVTAHGRLVAYVDLFRSPARQNLLCLCGAVTANWNEISDVTRNEVDTFFRDEIEWITTQVSEAILDGDLDGSIDANRFAVSFVAALEGALLLARTKLGEQAVVDVADHFLTMAGSKPYGECVNEQNET